MCHRDRHVEHHSNRLPIRLDGNIQRHASLVLDLHGVFVFGKIQARQIQDDLLDIYGDVKVFGKVPGGDIVANKKTLLLVKALEIASTEQRKELHELFETSDSDPEEKVRNVVAIYDQLNIKAITEKLANEYINMSFSLLDKISADKERKKELTLIASSLIGRDK